jgi:hypothetical protein
MKKTSFLCTILAMVMTAACLAANTISARLGIFFGNWVASMGVFSFPLIKEDNKKILIRRQYG